MFLPVTIDSAFSRDFIVSASVGVFIDSTSPGDFIDRASPGDFTDIAPPGDITHNVSSGVRVVTTLFILVFILLFY